jgi:hypothetical protein
MAQTFIVDMHEKKELTIGGLLSVAIGYFRRDGGIVGR